MPFSSNYLQINANSLVFSITSALDNIVNSNVYVDFKNFDFEKTYPGNNNSDYLFNISFQTIKCVVLQGSYMGINLDKSIKIAAPVYLTNTHTETRTMVIRDMNFKFIKSNNKVGKFYSDFFKSNIVFERCAFVFEDVGVDYELFFSKGSVLYSNITFNECIFLAYSPNYNPLKVKIKSDLHNTFVGCVFYGNFEFEFRDDTQFAYNVYNNSIFPGSINNLFNLDNSNFRLINNIISVKFSSSNSNVIFVEGAYSRYSVIEIINNAIKETTELDKINIFASKVDNYTKIIRNYTVYIANNVCNKEVFLKKPTITGSDGIEKTTNIFQYLNLNDEYTDCIDKNRGFYIDNNIDNHFGFIDTLRTKMIYNEDDPAKPYIKNGYYCGFFNSDKKNTSYVEDLLYLPEGYEGYYYNQPVGIKPVIEYTEDGYANVDYPPEHVVRENISYMFGKKVGYAHVPDPRYVILGEIYDCGKNTKMGQFDIRKYSNILNIDEGKLL